MFKPASYGEPHVDLADFARTHHLTGLTFRNLPAEVEHHQTIDDGEERSRGNLADLHHGWNAIAAQATRNTELVPGDILGSGTVGTGCILEHGDGRWLQRGDVVELEIEGIGVLRNRIGEKGGA